MTECLHAKLNPHDEIYDGKCSACRGKGPEMSKIKCWSCNYEKAQKAFSHAIWHEIEVDMGRNSGQVVLGLRTLDAHRTDGQRLCKLCINHILNEAADAIVFA